MIYQHLRRPGLTAIAAVLALSSTPLLAQVADPAPATSAPVAADPAPVAAIADPIAPVPDSVAAAPAEPLATTAVPPATSVKRTVVTRAVTKSASMAKAAATAPTRPARLPPTAAEIAPPLAATAATAAAVPVEMAPPMAATTPAPVAATPITKATAGPIDETLPIVGAGLGALALAGAGFAMSRRRRRRIDHEILLADDPLVETQIAEPMVTWPVAPEHPAARAPVAETRLATNNHSVRVEAAHAGPSEDNPSLSLKKRVKRAHALDQMERNGHLVPKPAPVGATQRRPSVSTWAQPAASGRMLDRQPTPTPAFQN
ncbi:MAG: hypothetical protein ABIR77_07080 [Sphingomicrobium sp.]